MANNSPLARWAGQPVVQKLRFQLTLDDPKLPKEEWITLRGDRAQLEALHETVTGYVQAFLEQSHSHLKASGVSVAEAPIATQSATRIDTALAGSSAPPGLSLRPKGLLKHDLALGTLATAETPNVISLNALQLFDLANALDDYAADLLVLPLTQSRQASPAFVRWGQLAATGLIVVGLSASVAKLIDSQSPSPSANQATGEQPLAGQPPTATQTPLPPIASNQKLPPPPPLGSTLPGSPGLPAFPSPSPITPLPKIGSAKTGGATSSQPTLTLPNPSQKQTGNQIAMAPQKSSPSTTARSAPPMPAPLAMKRELANAPSSQSTSLEGRAATADRSRQSEPTETAFDTIPQVAEVRQYLQQRWSPPQDLTQTLEYTLFVGAKGTIQRTVPLGQAAGDYVSRTGIPSAGEPFVSASSSGRNAKIRVVLSPDGSVKTFLEGYY
jgi:hypothetical protein